jgi:hypothetical protein
MKSKDHGDVLYFYGVTRKPGSRAGEMTGVDGVASIESMAHGGLYCWFSRVPRDEFAENLAKNMENLDWLAGMSIRHQRAIAAIRDSGDILPARFGTVFMSEDSLRADIEKRKAALEEDFRRVAASEEWGIKVFAIPPERPEAAARVRSGKEYLQAKSALLPRRRTPQSDSELQRFANALEKLAVATAEGGQISRGRRDLQFQISLLLKRDHRQKLETVVKNYSKEWKKVRHIECTGPWPPYSFVSRSSE